MVEMTGEEFLKEIEKSIKDGEWLLLFGIAFLIFATAFGCWCAVSEQWINALLVLVPCCFLSHTTYKTYSLLCEMYFQKGQVEALIRLERMANEKA